MSGIEISGNTIRIPIEIAMEDKTDLQNTLQQLRELQNRGGGDVIASGNLMDLDPKTKSNFSVKPASLTRGLLTDPASLGLGAATDIIPIIGEALIAAGLLDLLIQKLQEPGGPFDVRFKRDMQTEMFGEFTRQEQQARRIGQVQVIVASFDQFRNYNGANVSNTLSQVRSFGVSTIGMLDKARGSSVVIP